MPTTEEIIEQCLPPKYQGNPFLHALAEELRAASEQGGANWEKYEEIIVQHLTSLGLTESFAQEAARELIPRLEGRGLIRLIAESDDPFGDE